MSAYRRFISYMYDYQNGQRGKNCGFVKIEIKNEKCTMFFQLKNAPCQDQCNVYLYCKGAEPEFLFLQPLPIQKGCISRKIETSSIHIAGSNISFSGCSGILCTDENGNNCSTCWDNTGMIPEYKPIKPKLVEKMEAAVKTEIETPVETANETVLLSETGTTTAEETVTEPAENKSTETLQNIPPEEESGSSSEPRNPSQPQKFSDLWEHMQKEFPAMDPFEDDAIVESIKIAPADLGYLQACNLNLGSNQFLLHGYKNYHHLLLGRIHGQFQYIIGIPGVYDPQEQFMAKMFGFPCFKPIRECLQKNGQFGYWMRCFK